MNKIILLATIAMLAAPLAACDNPYDGLVGGAPATSSGIDNGTLLGAAAGFAAGRLTAPRNTREVIIERRVTRPSYSSSFGSRSAFSGRSTFGGSRSFGRRR